MKLPHRRQLVGQGDPGRKHQIGMREGVFCM
jgi:hypothetical protein